MTMTIRSIRRFTHSLAVSLALFLLAGPIAGNAQSTDDNQLVTQNAFGITSTFGKWPLNYIPFVYNPTGAPAGFTDAIVEQIYADAIAEWAGYCNVQFTYGGVDSVIDIDDINDGVPVFGWEDIGTSAGQAGPAFGGVSATWGHVLYSDGVFKLNPNIYTEIGSTPGEIIHNAISIRETAAHELGHLIGHGHSDQPDALMYSNPYNSISHTMQNDIDDCRKMYGYSTTYNAPQGYAPPAAGTNTYVRLRLSSNVDFQGAADAVDDGNRYVDTDALYMEYANQTTAYDDDLVTVIVDPYGRATAASNAAVVENDTQVFGDGLITFGQVRETPGTWTFYTYDSTGLLLTSSISVTTSLPAVNQPPASTFTFSEDISTRSISVTTDITSDPDGDDVSLDWHIPSVGQVANALQAAPLNDTQNVSLELTGLGFDWEIFADIRDSHTRYDTPTGTGSLGPPGDGFQDLHRYYASPLDLGPDLNGDNSSDIPLRNPASGQNWLYTMGGNLVTSSNHVSTVPAGNWSWVGSGDYNKDGKHDKLWWNNSTGQLWMHLMDGSTIVTSAAVATYSNVWRVAGSGDYNDDGNSDILLRNSSNGQIRILFMNGTTVSSNDFVRNLSLAWTVVGSGDYNGDGNGDILIRHSGTGQNWMFLMSGATILPASGPVNTVSAAASSIVGSGDYNSDGFDDILWHNNATGKIWVYLMQGTTIGIWDVVNTISTDWIVAGSGDYNGDSFSDILLYNTVTGQLWIYFMSGTSFFDSAPVGTISNLDWGVVNNK